MDEGGNESIGTITIEVTDPTVTAGNPPNLPSIPTSNSNPLNSGSPSSVYSGSPLSDAVNGDSVAGGYNAAYATDSAQGNDGSQSSEGYGVGYQWRWSVSDYQGEGVDTNDKIVYRNRRTT